MESAFDAIADTDALQAGYASAGPLTGGSYGVPPLRRMGILSLITTYHILTKKSNKKARTRVAFCTKENAPKPPLCKGRWHGVSRDGGIVRQEPTNSP